jgi:hypothetical protein
MVISPVGLRPEKDCAVEAQQQLKTTDPTSRQRERASHKQVIIIIIIIQSTASVV